MYWGKNGDIKNFIDDYYSNATIPISMNKENNNKINKYIIISSGDYLYMDCGLGNKYGDPTWCDDYKTWKTIYKIDLFKKYRDFSVLGAQITLFGELADDNSIIGRLFPRAISISEKLWNHEYHKIITSQKIACLLKL